MYVCICNAVTDSDIRNAVETGVHNMKQLRQATGCSSTCGCCREMAREILQQALEDSREFRQLLPGIQMA
jgi:bacterioferritin-associated ferredoxin